MKPNILFITTDQQRKDTLGCYGNTRIQTPNLDRLAAEGVIFNRAYCESPICLPSRVTMITGKSSRHHGVTLHNSSMRNDEKTIGGLLGNHGYRTHFIGKPHFKSQQHRGTEESIADWKDGKFADWHGPYAGFQTVDIILGHSNSLVGHYGEWLRQEHPEQYRVFREDHLKSLEVSCGQGVYRNTIPEEIYSSTYVGMRTCEFLETVKDSDQPFYCFASFPDPHWPIMPPEPYFSMYENVAMPADAPYNGEAQKDNYPPQFKRVYDGDTNFYDGGAHYMRDPDDAAKIMRAYWGSVTLIDKNVGEILAELNRLGMAENTIVVFTTDHGEYMGAHGMMAKGGFLWEEFINVPLIFRYPRKIAGGLRTDALLSFVDLVPTLLALAEIVDPEFAGDGISQQAVLSGNVASLRDGVTVMHPARSKEGNLPDQHALITVDGWKLVYHAGEKGGQLYDLKNDQRELNNLYNLKEYAQVQQRLCLELLDRLIKDNDKEAVRQASRADEFGCHVMVDRLWREEFEAMERLSAK